MLISLFKLLNMMMTSLMFSRGWNLNLATQHLVEKKLQMLPWFCVTKNMAVRIISVETRYLIGRCSCHVDWWSGHGDPIHDIDSESLITEDTDLYPNFPISLRSKFMILEENNAEFVSLIFGQWKVKDVEVCFASSVFIDSDPYEFNRGAIFLHHEE